MNKSMKSIEQQDGAYKLVEQYTCHIPGGVCVQENHAKA